MANKKQQKAEVRVEETRPLKWPDGQERTLIDRRVARAAWKKTFKQQLLGRMKQQNLISKNGVHWVLKSL